MKLSSLKLKKLSYILGGKLQNLKIKQKKFFSVFTTVKHTEI